MKGFWHFDAPDPRREEWKVNGITREAMVVLPAKTEGTPIVFGFHGHGGRASRVARLWKLHALWPDAITVYPQGLPTPRPRDPDGNLPGWQISNFGLHPNRDVLFFDALLKTATDKWKCDRKRIYVTGHSNGGGFTYCLWGQKPTLFAALAPVSASGERLIRDAKPCPVLAIGAKNNDIVAWEAQEKAIAAARKVNGTRAPVEVFLHSEGHAYSGEAPAKIIAFFKRHHR